MASCSGEAKHTVKTVAILTAGGIAPCLANSVAGLIERYTEIDPTIKIICYLNGYMGLLRGQSVEVSAATRKHVSSMHYIGGSPIGNSRTKLSNVKDCVARGLVREGEDPRAVASAQLVRDGVDVLHTIGGDDTNTAAADLAAYLAEHHVDAEGKRRHLFVIGLPKTIDNDIVPVAQSLGAWTAAEETARFFRNVVGEVTASPRVLMIHECMGRSCGYLTASAAWQHRKWLDTFSDPNSCHGREIGGCHCWIPELGFTRQRYDVHAVYLPEMELDIKAEAGRLAAVMDQVGCVNIFLSEGAGITSIVEEMRANGQEVALDPFGHVKLDFINPGQWFAKRFAGMIGAEKVLVQKSGYFSRAAAPNSEDSRLIKGCVDMAVDCAFRGIEGLIGHDEERGGVLRPIEFARVRGGKPFNVDLPWFKELLDSIGQPMGPKVSTTSH